jgi:hypothetical protein
MNKKGIAVGLMIILIGLVLATSGCISGDAPTATKKQLNKTEYEALVYSVADTMDGAEDTLIDTHDAYAAGLMTREKAEQMFIATSDTIGEQEEKMTAIIPPAGYETLNGYVISAIQNEKKCADLCVEWVKTGDAQSEEDATNYLMKAQGDLDSAMAEMENLGY